MKNIIVAIVLCSTMSMYGMLWSTRDEINHLRNVMRDCKQGERHSCIFLKDYFKRYVETCDPQSTAYQNTLHEYCVSIAFAVDPDVDAEFIKKLIE